MHENLLQQFARYPHPGRVKTRLCAALTAEEACAVHCELMELTARTLGRSAIGPAELWLDEVAEHRCIDACRRAGINSVREQPPGDLGWRMGAALSDGLQRSRRVILVGSDCPGMDERYLEASIGALDRADLVFGAAEDGGFVLVGARRTAPTMFADISWGGDAVLAQTLQRVKDCGLSAATLAPLYDIDRPEDLRRWRGP